ncbi:hypothetical protein UF70_0558 [Staphylococcus pasteuri]|nr:hypothetical protein UF70_0558 [Staphylococcus pasteuri]
MQILTVIVPQYVTNSLNCPPLKMFMIFIIHESYHSEKRDTA